MFVLAADISLRIIAAAAAVGLVLTVLRVRSGAARHAAWAAVLLVMLTMPVLTAIVPSVDVPMPAALAPDFAPEPDVTARAYTYEPPAGVRPSATPSAPPATALPSLPERSSVAAVNWRAAAAAIYLAGVLFFLVRITGGWILARRIVARATRVDGAGPVPVLESHAIAAPMTTGILTPCVLMPDGWRDWPHDKREAVLAHEHAHVRRRDALVTLLAQINRAIFWFHPLAWWLPRTLAVAAEHACDETAARQVGHPRRYAEVLIDMADAVRARGHRVSWQMIGVDGSGLLGTRIDRLLNGDAMARMSGLRRAGVAAGCAAALVLAIACRQQVAAEALRPDPEVQKQIDSNNARQERHRKAVAMSVADAAALERSLEANPDNVDARESLIIFYDQSGKVSWEEKLAGMRRHGLWRIANLPETDLWIPAISKKYDPEGYQQARQLWAQQTAKPDVTPKTLGRAAAFLSAYDKADAEQLLLRARQMEPSGPWTQRLGDLYARAIAGSTDPRYGKVDPDEATSPFALEARRKLDASRDAQLLAAAGNALRRYRGTAPVDIGLGYLERALAVDPQNVTARRVLGDIQHFERVNAIAAKVRDAGGGEKFNEFTDATYAAIAALPEPERIVYLPGAAESAYMRAENIEYTSREKPEPERADGAKRADAGFARARQLASDLLSLASRHAQLAQDNDALFRAHAVLGTLALRDGDRAKAVEHMRAAGASPISQQALRVSGFGVWWRLAEYLLRVGERESVAAFIESAAARIPEERERLLKDAARVRAGVMPLSYQYAEARR